MTVLAADVDVVDCAECGTPADEVTTCELCEERGCRCVVAPDQACTAIGGMVCAEHTENHRGCPTCDPPDPYDD